MDKQAVNISDLDIEYLSNDFVFDTATAVTDAVMERIAMKTNNYDDDGFISQVYTSVYAVLKGVQVPDVGFLEHVADEWAERTR